MPEGEVRVGGAGISKNTLLILGIGGVGAFLLLRPKAPTSPSIPPSSAAGINNELQSEMDQAQLAIQQLTAMTALEQQQQDEAYKLQAGVNPGLLQQCIPYATWYALDAKDRQAMDDQVRNGQAFKSFGPNGVCFAPTSMGVQGHPELVTSRSSSGLFGGSASVTGYAGDGVQPVQPPQGLLSGLLAALLSIFSFGRGTPYSPYPYPSSYPYGYAPRGSYGYTPPFAP